MRIAIYADDFIGDRGIAIVGNEILSRLLCRTDFSFIVIGSEIDLNQFKKRLLLEGNVIKYAANIQFHVYKTEKFRFLKKKFLDYHLIDADVFWYMKNYGTFRLKKKAKIVVTVHDLIGYIRPELQGGRKTFWRTFERNINVRTLKFADKLITISQYTAQEVTKRLKISEDIFTYIPNAVDTDTFTPLKKERIILYTGVFNEYKNLYFLIKTFEESNLSQLGWKLKLIGPDSKIKGSLKEYLKVIAKMINGVEILPSVENYKDLAKLYGQAYCVTSASNYEGFGLTVLEGMSAGAKIIASNITPHNEITRNSHDCQLIDTHNSEKWIKAFTDLENQFKADNNFSEFNRKIALENDWDNVANLYYKVLNNEQLPAGNELENSAYNQSI